MKKRNLLSIIACSGFILGSTQIIEAQERLQPVQREESSSSQILMQYEDKWLDREIERIISTVKKDEIVPELEYFVNLTHHLIFPRADDYIVIRGNDARFMESKVCNRWGKEYMYEMFKDLVIRGFRIYALVPEESDTGLDRLYKEISGDPQYSENAKNIVIKRTPKPMDKGYILIGDWYVSVWDSKRPPLHPEDIGTGSYFRACFRDYRLNELMRRQFLIETITSFRHETDHLLRSILLD